MVLEAQHFFISRTFSICSIHSITLFLRYWEPHRILKKGFGEEDGSSLNFVSLSFRLRTQKMVTCRNKLNMDWLLLISIDILSKEKFFAEVATLNSLVGKSNASSFVTSGISCITNFFCYKYVVVKSL